MPASKPQSLTTRHVTKSERADRAAAESALAPVTSLPSQPPQPLKGHAAASKVWKRIVALYFEIDGRIVTAFDEDLLVKYCLLEEECADMEKLRGTVLKAYTTLTKQLEKLRPKGDELKTFYKTLEQANALLARYQGLDARLDGKRKLLHALAQSLYLTPRSRAGVAPTPKEKEAEDGFGKEFD